MCEVHIMKQKILITPALPYVNNIPHLGNIIGSVLVGDILARKYRQETDKEVLFVCGKDEYGTQTMIKALEEDKSCYEICTEYGKIHDEVYKWFDISFDYFGRTSTNNPKTDKEWLHTEITQEIFKRLKENDYLSIRDSMQLYCNELDMFVADRFVSGICYVCGYDKASGDQCDKCTSLLDLTKIINPECKIKDKKYSCVLKSTTHYYLDLPKLNKELDTWFNSQSKNWSKNVPPVTQHWLSDLKERCITRDISWGTPLPSSESLLLDKNFYCWFDAPIGYMSCVANYFKEQGLNPLMYKEWFCSEEPMTTIHAFSKDNIVFHTIMFPATLMATKDDYSIINSTYKIASCEYLNYLTEEGVIEKFSKSRKIGIFGDQVIKVSNKLGIVPDYWRYYLVKIRPETSDSVFNLKEFVDVCNTDLCCKYGNLINRTKKLFEELVKIIGNYSFEMYENNFVIEEIIKLEDKYNDNINEMKLRAAQTNCMEMVHFANQYISNKTPWKLNLQNSSELEKFLIIMSNIAWMFIIINECFYPFIPGKANLFRKTYEIKGHRIHLNFTNLNGLPFSKLVLNDIKRELSE